MTRSKAFKRSRARIAFQAVLPLAAGAVVMTAGAYYCLDVRNLGKSFCFFFVAAIGEQSYEFLREHAVIRAEDRRQRKFYERFPIPW